jgi:hypothetical protein
MAGQTEDSSSERRDLLAGKPSIERLRHGATRRVSAPPGDLDAAPVEQETTPTIWLAFRVGWSAAWRFALVSIPLQAPIILLGPGRPGHGFPAGVWVGAGVTVVCLVLMGYLALRFWQGALRRQYGRFRITAVEHLGLRPDGSSQPIAGKVKSRQARSRNTDGHYTLVSR